MADSINSFKSRLDKFWSSRDFVHEELSHLLQEVLETRFPIEVIYSYVIRKAFSNTYAYSSKRQTLNYTIHVKTETDRAKHHKNEKGFNLLLMIVIDLT